MLNFYNGWKASAKRGGKFLMKFRIGKLTVVDVVADINTKTFIFTLFNFTVRN